MNLVNSKPWQNSNGAATMVIAMELAEFDDEDIEITAYDKWMQHKQRRSSARRISLAKEAGQFHRSVD